MFARVLAMMTGLAGAAGLSQFPEFSQQYLQRLAGKVDQLETQVSQIDQSASALEMTRDEYLADLAQSRSGEQASEKASSEIILFDRLSPVLDDLRESNAYQRLLSSPKAADVEVAQRTMDDFQPAVPLTTEGAVFAAVGFFAGWGIWSMLWGVISWPMRRARRRRLAKLEAHHAQAHMDTDYDDHDHDHAPEDHDHDPPDLTPRGTPQLEYFGDAQGAVGQALPEISLAAVDGRNIDLSVLQRPIILFTMPILGQPGVAFPMGWGQVSGGEHATPLACSLRDHANALKDVGVTHIYGLSTGTKDEHQEAMHRLALPYQLLSDPDLEMAQDLNLPCFSLGDDYYYEAAVYLLNQGKVTAVMHPLRDPTKAGARLVEQLRGRKAGAA